MYKESGISALRDSVQIWSSASILVNTTFSQPLVTVWAISRQKVTRIPRHSLPSCSGVDETELPTQYSLLKIFQVTALELEQFKILL